MARTQHARVEQEKGRHVCSDLACCRGVDCVVDAADNAPSEKPWVDIERKTSQRRASAQGTGIMNCRTLHQHKTQARQDQRMLHTEHHFGKVRRENIPLK